MVARQGESHEGDECAEQSAEHTSSVENAPDEREGIRSAQQYRLSLLSPAERIAAINTLMAHAATEQQIYWQRSMLFLTINSALLGFALASKAQLSELGALILASFGIYLNSAWRGVLVFGQFFAERWKEDARAVANSSESLREVYRGLGSSPRISRPVGHRKPSQVMKELSILFQITWVGVALLGTSRVWLPALLQFASIPP